jgi:hypothetical protein
MMLVFKKGPFTDTFEEATFIMSFFESACFLLLNLRYNVHRKHAKQDRYRV